MSRTWAKPFSRFALLCGTAGVLTAMGAVDLWAQSKPEATEEIVVVARRRAENIQKVPLAITAISADDLKKRNISNTADLTSAIPSLRSGGQARDNQQFFLRGQGPGQVQTGNRQVPGATTYFAEVPTILSGPGVFYDMQSVQVVKGPQGTLYGRNTTGGAVLLVPKKPGNEFGGYLTGDLGNYNNRKIEGAITIPIVKNELNIRLATSIQHRDGFTHNIATGKDLDDINYQAYRASIDWKPGDKFENYFIGGFKNIHQHGNGQILKAVNPDATVSASVAQLGGQALRAGGNRPSTACFTPLTNFCGFGNAGALIGGAAAAGGFAVFGYSNAARTNFLTMPNALNIQNSLGNRTIDSNFAAADYQQIWDGTNITTYEFNEYLKLKNIIGYRLNEQFLYHNLSGGFNFPAILINPVPADGWTNSFQQKSEEFQVQGKSFGKRLDWILGGYLEFNDNGPGTHSSRGLSLGSNAHTVVNATDSSKSLFGEGTYDLKDLVPGLKFTGGYRYNWDTRKQTFIACRPTTAAGVVIEGCNQVTAIGTASRAFNAPSWNTTLHYEITPNTTAYVRWAHSYKAGGTLSPPPVNGSNLYESEKLTEWELGLKSSFELANMPTILDVSLYKDHYKGRQLAGPQALNSAGGVTSTIVNGPQTNYWGAEIEAQMRPFRDLKLGGFYSYTQARNGGPLSTGELGSEQVVGVPRIKYGATVDYHMGFIADTLGSLDLHADYYYQGHFANPGSTLQRSRAQTGFSDVQFTDPLRDVEGYGVLNMRLDWTNIAQSRLDIGLYATNILDNEYVIGGYPLFNQIGFDSFILGEPRMYGAQVTFHFGKDN